MPRYVYIVATKYVRNLYNFSLILTHLDFNKKKKNTKCPFKAKFWITCTVNENI